MNKKISTLFTAGLLMAGALLGTANAQTVVKVSSVPVDEFVAGKKYVMVLSDKDPGMGATSFVYGFSKMDGKGLLTPATCAIDLGTNVNLQYSFELPADDKIANYAWTVSETKSVTSAEYAYEVNNYGLGVALRAEKVVDATYSSRKIVLNTKIEDKTVLKSFVFGAACLKHTADGEPLLALDAENTTTKTSPAGFFVNATKVDATKTYFFELVSQDINSAEGAKELNTLYNNSGFSFKVQEPAVGVTVAGNIFGDKRVYAHYLKAPIPVPDTKGGLVIPVGMYFFTDVAGDLTDVNNWLNSTVIAVSSTETLEVTNADRAKGQGFVLVETLVKDMNLYNGTEAKRLSSKEELPVANANFSLWKDYANGDYAYGLQVAGFRYQADPAKDDHTQASIELNSRKIANVWSLVSLPNSGATSIFALAESTAVKGITLLNTTAKAAVYNIRLINEDQKITSLNDKYLTQGYNVSSEWAAKSKIFADLDYPSYQFMISKIGTDGTGITFKNRESGKELEATLYPTDMDNVYEWSVAVDMDARPIYSEKNTYGEIQAKTCPLTKCYVELIKVENVDSYAGFVDADPGTLVTMAFARDNYETSNKLYTTVDADNKINADGKFASAIENAAQWRLVMNENPNMLTRTIAYNKAGKVAYMAKADTIIANKYALEYVKDGQALDLYLNAEETIPVSSIAGRDLEKYLMNADYYSIKQNVDGSISFLKTLAVGQTDENGEANSQLTVALNGVSNEYEYEKAADRELYAYNDDKAIRTYLFDEAIEISLPGNEGHVSLESEMGNYISMDQDRAAIVVDNEENTFYLHVADKDAIIPSFYISCSQKDAERMYMFNPEDSVNYYVGPGKYDRKYQWAENVNKVLFKQASINATRDTLTTSIKGETKQVASKPDNNNKNVVGGLENFKYNIIQAPDADGMYLIRSNRPGSGYLYSINEKMTWTIDKLQAMKFTIASVTPPVSNEEIEAGTIKVVAGEGNVTVYGAAGKKVFVSDVLGKTTTVVATSDSQVIPAAQGVVFISVEGEAAVKAIVK